MKGIFFNGFLGVGQNNDLRLDIALLFHSKRQTSCNMLKSATDNR